MDAAYDHIQEESLSADEERARSTNSGNNGQSQTLNDEFQQAFKAVSASPWGARLGGFFGQVKKQSESLYSDAPKIYAAASSQATAGLTNLVDQARNITFEPPTSNTAVSFSDPTFTLPEQDPSPSKGKEKDVQSETKDATPGTEHTARPESLPADIVKEATSQATSLVTRFRSEAPSFLTRIQKAEDAADEALLKFGSNLKNFLREAVTVTAPEDSTTKDGEAAEVLFETNDAEGKRVFHTSRFDAQLHVIHTTPTSFTQDPESGEYTSFSQEFDIDEQTSAIAADLDKYEELRRAMEKLVPEKVEYKSFWSRYYFLRKVIEEEERRRREVLKGATAEPEEELGWGSDDSDAEDNEQDSTPTPHLTTSSTTTLTESNAKSSSTTSSEQTSSAPVQSTQAPTRSANELLKPTPSPRHSEDDLKSTADSDASYDIISGATSRAPGSPKEKEAAASAKEDKEKKEKEKDVVAAVKEEESDEEDWE